MIRTATGAPWNADETACWRCEGCDSPLNKLRVGAAITPEQAAHSSSTVQKEPHPIRWAVSRRAGGPARSIISQGRGAHLVDQSKIAGIRGRTCRQSQRTRIVFSTILRSKPPDATGPLVPSGPACQINLAWLFDHANSTSCSVT